MSSEEVAQKVKLLEVFKEFPIEKELSKYEPKEEKINVKKLKAFKNLEEKEKYLVLKTKDNKRIYFDLEKNKVFVEEAQAQENSEQLKELLLKVLKEVMQLQEVPKDKLLEVFKEFKLEVRSSKGTDQYKTYYLRTFMPKENKIDFDKLKSYVKSLQRRFKERAYSLQRIGEYLVLRPKKYEALDLPIYFNTKTNKVYVREKDVKANPRLLSYILFRTLSQVMTLEFTETKIA